ncbi:hypothetical protein SAMN02927895_02363 [Belnapia rosea]|nr:hypothetical protein SAMN02927895_02363 [Belnapia rosea]
MLEVVRDYGMRLDVSEVMIHLSMGALLFRRIAHQNPQPLSDGSYNVARKISGIGSNWSSTFVTPGIS